MKKEHTNRGSEPKEALDIEIKIIELDYSPHDTSQEIEKKLDEILRKKKEHDLLYTLVERYGMSREDYDQRTRTRLQNDRHFYIGLYNRKTQECLGNSWMYSR